MTEFEVINRFVDVDGTNKMIRGVRCIIRSNVFCRCRWHTFQFYAYNTGILILCLHVTYKKAHITQISHDFSNLSKHEILYVKITQIHQKKAELYTRMKNIHRNLVIDLIDI